MGARGKQCTVCRHEARHRIDIAIAAGASPLGLARKYGLAEHAIRRHGKNHLSPERRAQLVAGEVKMLELAEKATESGLSLLDYLRLLRASLTETYLRVMEGGDAYTGQLLAGRVAEIIRLEGQMTGEISRITSAITNNTLVMASPQFETLKQALAEALLPYPDAMAAVAARLERLAGPTTAAPLEALTHVIQ